MTKAAYAEKEVNRRAKLIKNAFLSICGVSQGVNLNRPASMCSGVFCGSGRHRTGGADDFDVALGDFVRLFVVTSKQGQNPFHEHLIP
jgi:hypothetical protein